MSINIVVKKFTPSEIKVAKKIVDDLVISRKIFNASVGYPALASQFVYNFCGINDNEDKLIAANSNLDVNAAFTQYDLVFFSTAHPDYDQHLTPLFDNLFKIPTEELMELVFQFNLSQPTSIKDFVIMMADIGFVYKKDSIFLYGDCPGECWLLDLMKEFVFV